MFGISFWESLNSLFMFIGHSGFLFSELPIYIFGLFLNGFFFSLKLLFISFSHSGYKNFLLCELFCRREALNSDVLNFYKLCFLYRV